MTRSLRVCALVAAIVSVCAVPQSTRVAKIRGIPIAIDAAPVPLNPQNEAQTAIGDFTYAGGLILTSRDTDRLHGLSDVDITGANTFAAVTDLGDFLDARLVLDGAGRLAGLADARLTALTGLNGKPLTRKAQADAEGLAVLPNGDRLVSFERHHRIRVYPAGGGTPRPAPSPAVSFPSNEGMEALAADPHAGADAYVVGAESTGDTWTCRLSVARCMRGPSVVKPTEFGLVALRRLPGLRTGYLLRAYDAARGSRISLQIFRSATMIARMDIAKPLTVDNFEGLAAVPDDSGAVRFYLLSDDNASASQRTLLLAFDWRPGVQP